MKLKQLKLDCAEVYLQAILSNCEDVQLSSLTLYLSLEATQWNQN